MQYIKKNVNHIISPKRGTLQFPIPNEQTLRLVYRYFE